MTEWLRGIDGRPEGPSLPYLVGEVVLVHVLEPDHAGSMELVRPLVNEIFAACEDRKLMVVTLVPKGAVQAHELLALGLEHPVAAVPDAFTSPYFGARDLGHAYVCLIGRAGEVRWQGSPVTEAEALSAALEEALALPRGARLARDPDANLASAMQAHWNAEWAKARKEAEKVLRRHGRKTDVKSLAIAADAEMMIETIERHAEDLLAEARGAVERGLGLVYWSARSAIEHGFPRTDFERQVRELEQAAFRSDLVLVFTDAEKLYGLLPQRPLFFPIRRTKAGDRFARELQKFIQASDNRAGPTHLAQDFLDRYLGPAGR